ncbi:hypothetical protein B0T26DRAFT_850142 [Lasiosphaeria miniovina]|uniref:Uncharacterized protein n=1 Tax=Lasiosphaeria miniovina TaxID=1954250 RepID=A0AA40ATV5_9PEZI|nr:uncharacterized protein B0T26DRAFT_850142 [Lasiosphaeria miniovina]KAK0721899.1 hypothetical protein B0T26DRAFT_850142 [Lasiosphaeria miniovina]
MQENILPAHLASHGIEICPIPTCRAEMAVGDLSSHFARQHGDTEACPEIGCIEELQTESQLHRHLVEFHSLVRCPFCGELSESDTWMQHITTCSACPERLRPDRTSREGNTPTSTARAGTNPGASPISGSDPQELATTLYQQLQSTENLEAANTHKQLCAALGLQLNPRSQKRTASPAPGPRNQKIRLRTL